MIRLVMLGVLQFGVAIENCNSSDFSVIRCNMPHCAMSYQYRVLSYNVGIMVLKVTK